MDNCEMPLTTAFTRAVRSAQIVPPQENPGIRALAKAVEERFSSLLLTVGGVLDVRTLDDLAIDGEESSSDAEF